ncbi:MAG: leucine--tRNA ligase [Candidatus Neptunochlamydia sp.]|nr:leucine--tRNA ligase [Candidatus Neptunochlamydia sp.]
MKYNHLGIEKKWQEHWKKKKAFKAEVDPSKPKYYILDMFPYPSGAGLHVGHVTGYTATDILARYKRQQGYNVLHPMGWDSFGLQAEQHAIRTGTHPKDTTEKNISTYRRQLQSLGFSYDWDREFATSDPGYYKWTQWIFTKLYEKGLAYEADILVNFCPALGTVLANEEVEDGKAKEGGYPVERRPLRQWVLKITEYAERLLKDLDLLDWPDYLKTLQRNWIGRSEGTKFTLLENETKQPITVFTTRHDTIFAMTFLVISPEHPLVKEITTPDHAEAVEAYLKEIAKKSDFERTELAKEKTGIWTGAYAINPANDELIPIWVADYVLAGYGTGAVMGVPGGDERDFEFTKKYNLAVVPPYDPIIDDVPEGMTKEDVRVEILAGKRCWNSGGIIINGRSDKLDINGLQMEEAKEAVADWLEENQYGKRCITYKLRDWLFSRQRYWGEPFPILHFEDGSKRTLDLDELPLTLPELTDYKPQSEGKTPLDNVPDWINVTDPKTGRKAKRETNTMPQWAGSCWYYLRFCDPLNTNKAWGKEEEKYWMPVDMYVGGVEHAVLHLLYSRFWHKVLYDCGDVSTPEPFQTLRNQGLITTKSFKKLGGGYVAPEGAEGETDLIEMVEKMSKSKLNGVPPDEIIEEYGADSLRLYEMFMGPFDKEKLWNSEAISGCRRFLDRFYALVMSGKVSDEEHPEGMKLAHKLVQGVQKDIEEMLFNTAISKMMEFVNAFTKLETYPKKSLEMATIVLSSFAPHLAEECWEHFGHQQSLMYASFPKTDPKFLTEDSVTYVIQVNGKFRGKWELPKGQIKESLLEAVQKDKKMAKYLTGEIVKVIFVPEKLLNILVK